MSTRMEITDTATIITRLAAYQEWHTTGVKGVFQAIEGRSFLGRRIVRRQVAERQGYSLERCTKGMRRGCTNYQSPQRVVGWLCLIQVRQIVHGRPRPASWYYTSEELYSIFLFHFARNPPDMGPGAVKSCAQAILGLALTCWQSPFCFIQKPN